MLLARSLLFMSLVCIGVNADGYGDGKSRKISAEAQN